MIATTSVCGYPGSFLANGIGAEGLAIFGCVYVILPALVVITIEWATIHAIVRRQSPWPTRAVVAANFWSLLAGIPVMILFARNFDRLVPSDLHLYFPAYLRFSLMKYAAYFIVTVVVELAYVLWLARRERAWSPLRLSGAVMLANLLTYAVLCPAVYFGMRPTHAVRTFTADTSWAPPRLGPIIYIDHPTKSLMRIDADGSNRATLIADPVDAFLLTRDLRACLYLFDGRLHYQRIGEPESRRTLEGKPPNYDDVPIGVADLSPSGNRIAYLSANESVDNQGLALIVLDLRLDRVVNIGTVNRTSSFHEPEVLWSHDETQLWVSLEETDDWLIRLKEDLTFDLSRVEAIPSQSLAANYAYAASYTGYGAHHLIGGEDVQEDLHGRIYGNLFDNHIEIARGAPWPRPREVLLKISDNPGVAFVSNHRRFGDVGFLPHSRLAVLEDKTFDMLYLADADGRRVGKLVSGKRFILATEKYQKRTPETRRDETKRRRASQ